MYWALALTASICQAQHLTDLLEEQYESYYSEGSNLRVELTLNQTKYAPGDTLWLQAYVIDGSIMSSSGKQILEVNLVDSQGQSRQSIRFMTRNGLGSNQMVLSDDLEAGYYLITAHFPFTGAEQGHLLFEREVTIVKDKVLGPIRNNIQVAVEGGSLLGGVSNTVVVKTDPAMDSLLLMTRAGVVTQTVPLVGGWSRFSFTPERRGAYLLQTSNGLSRVDLPVASNGGIALHKLPSEAGKGVSFEMRIPSGSALQGKRLVGIVTSGGEVVHSVTMDVAETDLRLTVPAGALPPGRSQLSVFDSDGRVMAQRRFENGQKVVAGLNLDGKTFLAGEKVAIDISLNSEEGMALSGNGTLRVLNRAVLSGSSSLNGDGTSRFLDTSADPKIRDMALVLLGVEEDWDQIRMGKEPGWPRRGSSRIRLEGSPTLHGLRLPRDTKLTIYLQRHNWPYPGLVEPDGSISLSVPDFYGDEDLFYLTEFSGSIRSDLTIAWDQPSISWPRAPVATIGDMSDSYAIFSGKRQLIRRSYEVFTNSSFVPTEAAALTPRPLEEVVNKYDQVYDLDDYVSFQSVEEVVKEIIRPLTHAKIGGQSVVKFKYLRDPPTGNPLYFIDGHATLDTEHFLSLPTSDIHTISIVKDYRKISRLGLIGRNGIVVVDSKSGSLGEALINEATSIRGLNAAMRFPTLSGNQSAIPEFRSTIFWAPEVPINAGKGTVEFFLSDDIGEMDVILEGYTVDGSYFRESVLLNVLPTNGN